MIYCGLCHLLKKRSSGLFVFILMSTFLNACVSNKIIDYRSEKKVRVLQKFSENLEKGIENIDRKDKALLYQLDQDIEQLQSRFEKRFGEGQLIIEESRGDLKLSLIDTILFEPGASDLGSKGKAVLSDIVPFLKGTKGFIEVAGFTDDKAVVKTKKVNRNNWYLSAKRAVSVVSFLQEEGISPARLVVMGYGEYRPVVPNDSTENCRRNRRVEILVRSWR